MYKYGFELEGFYAPAGIVSVPPREYSTDGFPGLVELRTSGALSLKEAYSKIIELSIDTPSTSFCIHSHIFTREDKAVIRRRHVEKSAWDIRNLYMRSPRLLGNRTIASLQVNISNEVRLSYRDKKGKLIPAEYGLLDTARIVWNLDKEFVSEIKRAGRQPGEYCIKDNKRLEYRSLPNFVFPFGNGAAREFLARITKAVEKE